MDKYEKLSAALAVLKSNNEASQAAFDEIRGPALNAVDQGPDKTAPRNFSLAGGATHPIYAPYTAEITAALKERTKHMTREADVVFKLLDAEFGADKGSEDADLMEQTRALFTGDDATRKIEEALFDVNTLRGWRDGVITVASLKVILAYWRVAIDTTESKFFKTFAENYQPIILGYQVVRD